jgi:hypothetical protein
MSAGILQTRKKGNLQMIQIQLGAKAKNVVSGFEGVLTGRAEYLTGCVQWLVSPGVDKDGKVVESHWLDEGRLVAGRANARRIGS